MKKEISEEYLSAKQLAERKGLTEKFIMTAKDKYGLPYYKLGRLVRFKLAEFEKWTEERHQNAC